MDVEKYKRKADKYVLSIRKFIKAEYGSVPEVWEAQLTQLRDLYLNYLKAADAQEEDVTVIKLNNGKTLAANFNLNVMVQITSAMDRILKQFGLNPLALKKLKVSSPVEGDEEEDFMDSI